MTKKILFWLGVFAVSLLVMVRSAAASGSVAAVSGGLQWQSNGQTYTRASTALASCNLLYNSMTPGLFNNLGLQFLNVDTTTGQNVYYCKIQTISNGYTNNYSDYPYNFPLTCPANAAGTSSCTCNTGYQPNAGATACVAVTCPTSGTFFRSSYVDVGTVPDGIGTFSLDNVCSADCAVHLEMLVTPTPHNPYFGLVLGVKHYFAWRSYFYSGNSCSGGSLPVDAATITSSCAAGQSLVTGSNGYAKCFNNSTGSEVNSNSASAVAAAKTLSDARIAAAIAAASAAAASSGLNASGVAAAQAGAAGGSSGASGSWNPSNPYPPGDPMNQYCVDHPDASLCSVKTACDNNPNLVSCAEFGTVADDVPLGIKNVNVSSITPITVGGAGACPAPRAMVLHGHTYYMSFATYCNFATGIKPIILAFAWLAASGLLVGGFKAA